LEEADTVAIAPAKKVSHSDPQARWTAAPGGPDFYAYSTNYLVGTNAGIVVDNEDLASKLELQNRSTHK